MPDGEAPERRAPYIDAWVLYDTQCGFCSRWVPFWGRVLRRAGIGFRSLQSAACERYLAPSCPMTQQDLTLACADGSILRGADVYRFAMRRIPWARPLYALTVAPILGHLFDSGYRVFARNRYRVSRLLKLAPREE